MKLINKAADGKIFDTTATTTVRNLTGIYDRPAAILVQKASSFNSNIRIKAKSKNVDAKSILMVMSMGLRCGDEVTIFAEGSDAKQAVDELISLIDSSFGEAIGVDSMGDDYCFACGENNPIGLHLAFNFDGERIFTKKIVEKEFQGYEGAVHGGILSAMLDETMCKFVNAKFNQKSMTARLEVRFKYPTPINQEVKITAWQENQRKNIITMRSTLQTSDGMITAEATAKFALLSAN